MSAMTSEEEVWRPCHIRPDGYEVSDRGNVRSNRRREKQRPVRLREHRGYLRVTLTLEDGSQNTFGVHRLVAAAFYGPSHLMVRHLDGNPSNNHVSNLQYGTNSENVLDSVRHGRHHLAKLTHCKRGHEFTEENTGRSGARGHRYCRRCANDRNNAARAAARLRAKSTLDEGGRSGGDAVSAAPREEVAA